MTLALLLFDIDGCTAVVPTAKLSQEARSSVQCEASVAGKKFMVEVLAVADDMQTLNKFEESWSLSHRAKHLTCVKQKVGQRKGGFLTEWPEDADSFQLDGTGPAINLPTKPNTMGSLQKQCNGQNSKRIPVRINAKKESTMRARKVMIRTVLPETQSASLPKMPQSRKSLQSLERLKVQVAKMRKNPQEVDAPAQKNSRLPIKKQVGAPAQKRSRLPIKKQVGAPAQKRSRLPIKKQTNRKTSESIPVRRNMTEKTVGEAVNTRPVTSEIQGTNGRQVKVLYEGAGDYVGNAIPGRDPQFYDGLSADQVDLLQVRLEEFRKGTVSMSTQTDHVVIISTDEEMKELQNSDRPKMVDKATDTSEITKDEISTKLEKVIQLLENPSKVSNLSAEEKQQQNQSMGEEFREDAAISEKEKTCKKSIDFTNEAVLVKEEPAVPHTGEQVSWTDSVSGTGDEYTDDIMPECSSAAPKHEPLEVKELMSISTDRQPTDFKMDISKSCQQPVIIKSPTVVMTTTQHELNNFVSPGCDFAAQPSTVVQNTMASETDSTTYNYLNSLNTPAPRYNMVTVPAISSFSETPVTDTSIKDCAAYSVFQPMSSSLSSMAIETDETESQTFSFQSSTKTQSMEPILPVAGFTSDTFFPKSSVSMEIQSAADMVNVPFNANVRIAVSTVREVYASSANFGNFAWNLAKRLYKKEERFGKCFNSRSSAKVPLSPRRKSALTKAFEEILEGQAAKPAFLKIANDAIVTGLRNESRQRVALKEMTLNFNMNKLK